MDSPTPCSSISEADGKTNTALNAEEKAAAVIVARYRSSLEWMLMVPDWEEALAARLKDLQLPGARQGVGHRAAVMSLPLESKHALLQAFLKVEQRVPTSSIALKVSRQWGIAKYRRKDLDTRLSGAQWEALKKALMLRMATTHQAYKKAQNLLYQNFSYIAERSSTKLCRDASKKEDCAQEARLALLQAIDRIDPEKSFAPYARAWTQRGARNFLLRNRLPFKVPINTLSQAAQTSPEDLEPSQRNLALVHQALKQGTLELDAIESDLAVIDAQSETRPDWVVSKSDLKELVQEALLELTEKQRDVVAQRYGLMQRREAATLQEIAKLSGISRQQVARRAERAFANLQKQLTPLQREWAW